jgi:putative IMPACT (imprinted ancient) family translation regulator
MHEIIEKKSRFIGYAAEVKSEDEAKAFIAKIANELLNESHGYEKMSENMLSLGGREYPYVIMRKEV